MVSSQATDFYSNAAKICEREWTWASEFTTQIYNTTFQAKPNPE